MSVVDRGEAPNSRVDRSLVARAEAAAELIAPLSLRIEAERRLPKDALDALTSAGAMKLFVPRAYGGSEANLSTAIAVLEAIGRADGSAGWIAMIGATSGLMSAFLAPDVAREVFAADDAVTAGVFAPMGRAARVDGGFRVKGRWSFASGCEHTTFRMGGAIVEGDPPLASGAPDVRSMLFRAADTRVIDTWSTSGLRGTGSHDIEVDDVFVPAERSFSLVSDRSRVDAPLYRLPYFGLLSASVAAVGVGIASAALLAFHALARAKTPQGSRRTVAHREVVQLDVARAEAKVRGARALLREAVADIERESAAGEPSVEARALLRVAACHAAEDAAAAVDLVYEAGGASSIYTSSPLQRHFRDVHVLTQHVMVGKTAAAMAGRALLGVPGDATLL